MEEGYATGKVKLEDHRIRDKPASGSVRELLVCRDWVIGFVFSSHLHIMKLKPSKPLRSIILNKTDGVFIM